MANETTVCRLCGKPEFLDVSGLCRTIQPCQKCDNEVCSDCSDSDYDAVGDPLSYVCVSWVCKDNQCDAANIAA